MANSEDEDVGVLEVNSSLLGSLHIALPTSLFPGL